MTPDPPTFEDALADLEAVLRALEDGSTGLEDAIAQYERGVGLLKHCYGLLKNAEQRIVLLAGVDGEDRPVTFPFDHAPAVDAKPPAKRPAPRRKAAEGDGDGRLPF